MLHDIEKLKEHVRAALDEDKADRGIIEGMGSLSIDEIIESKIIDGALYVEQNCPVDMLEAGHNFGGDIVWESVEGHGSGYIVLPSEFMRLISFKMSDWVRGVTVAIDDTHPKYALQGSRFGGIRGCPQNPVVAIIQNNMGKVLEFYSCSGGSGVRVSSSSYRPYPSISEGRIEFSERNYRAVVYAIASFVRSTYGEYQQSQILMDRCNNLIGKSVQ